MTDIARLKITLDNVEPQVLRRIEVPIDIEIHDLHLVFQKAMGWDNAHLYDFEVGRVSWGGDVPYDGWGDSPASGDEGTLADILAEAGKKKAFRYEYDPGDSWRHSVAVEKVGPPEEGIVYPRLLEAKGACPLEDIGGSWGYANFLEAIADPAHERHEEMIEWVDEGFDPEKADAKAIEERLQAFGKHLARDKERRKTRSRIDKLRALRRA
jgi:hypothetical protein